MKVPDDIEKRAAAKDFVANVTLMNDWFMTCFFQDGTEEIQEVLRIILDDERLVVTAVETQRQIKGLGHSLSLDVYAVLSDGRLHDIEIQRSNAGAGRKRARYHSSMLDAANLQKNTDFEKLPDTHVIFITERDVLGRGLPLYHVERTILETGESFGDMTHIIYVNGSDRNDKTKLGRLMQDFNCKEAEKINNEVLRRRMIKLKKEEVGDMYLYEKYALQEAAKAEKRGEKRGIKQGREELYTEQITRLLEKGKTVEEIVEYLGVTEEKVLKIKEKIQDPQPVE